VFASRCAGVLGGKAEALTRRVPGSVPTGSLETFFFRTQVAPSPSTPGVSSERPWSCREPAVEAAVGCEKPVGGSWE
jgi:hypothetical protein